MYRFERASEMYTTLEKTELSRSTNPSSWKNHFNQMKNSNLTKRGKRVLIKGGEGGGAAKPTLKVVSPSQQSVDLAKGEIKTIKPPPPPAKRQSGSTRRTSKTCQRAKKSWRRTPAKSRAKSKKK